MSTSGHQRIRWAPVPNVLVDLPVCPYCHGLKFETQRSDDNGDGSRTKEVICRTCGKPYKITAEIPESGNVIWPVS